MRRSHYRLGGLIATAAALGVAAPAVARSQHGFGSEPKPQRCVVPQLTGDTLAIARRDLTAAHCTLGAVAKPTTSLGRTLIVSATKPKAGKRERNRARVSVTLKPKAAPAPVPAPTPEIPVDPGLPWQSTQTSLAIVAALQQNYDAQSPGDASYFEVNTTLAYSTPSQPLLYLVGEPITYAVVDLDTDKALASFAGMSGTISTYCSIGMETDYPANTTVTLTGEPISPYQGAPPLPACGLGTVSFPYADTVVLEAMFAGNSTYRASGVAGRSAPAL